jgi:MraZ protein
MSAASFISTMTGTLDSKGRVCIPAPFRDVLTAHETAGVYVCPSYHEPTLDAFGEEAIRHARQIQATLDPFFSREHDIRATAIIARTVLLPRDENGRVRLPDEMIAYAGLKDRVTFVGLDRKFQIWDSERYAAVQAERLKRAVELLNAKDAPA